MSDEAEQCRALLMQAFPGHEAAPLLTLLMQYGAKAHHHEVQRVRAAIVQLCDGDPARLAGHLAVADVDYRDVLAAASLPAASAAQIETEQAAVRALLARWGKR